MIKLFCFAPGFANREAGGLRRVVAQGSGRLAVAALCFPVDGSDPWLGSSMSACQAAREAFPNPRGEKIN